MVKIFAQTGGESILVVGHGLRVKSDFELSPGITLTNSIPKIDYNVVANEVDGFIDYAALVTGERFANFSIRIDGEPTAKLLAVKGWNALWDFHLLAIATKRPVCSLFTLSLGENRRYSIANRTILTQPFKDLDFIKDGELNWARQNKSNFDKLIGNATFSSAMRCFGNAHFLPDLDMRIMLLWSGIERLLEVDSELTRRIALYSSIVIPGTQVEKVERFKSIKILYNIRSKAVHGGKISDMALQEGYEGAAKILAQLLSRCVEIGRVPSPSELDELSLSQSV